MEIFEVSQKTLIIIRQSGGPEIQHWGIPNA
jgi:hypothetical protein